jgi:hypothetical protein
VTATTTLTAPAEHEAAPTSLFRPAPHRPAPPVAVQPRTPRPVRATVHAGSVPLELLLGQPDGPASALDVDPRLLIVHRPQVAAVEAPTRSLAPPSDVRRELRERRRRLVATMGSAVVGALVTGLSIASALA